MFNCLIYYNSANQRIIEKLNTFQIGDNYKIYNSRIFTKDKRNLNIFITSAFPSGETQKNGKLIQALNRTIDTLEAEFNHEINVQYRNQGDTHNMADQAKMQIHVRMFQN